MTFHTYHDCPVINVGDVVVNSGDDVQLHTGEEVCVDCIEREGTEYAMDFATAYFEMGYI